MRYKIYQIDTFTDKLFTGNPAAVCPLENWLSDDVLQKIAAENNLSETAFYCKKDNQYRLRWFTPTVEVDLCGHATLAAAYVLFHHENHPEDSIDFYSDSSGLLSVSKHNDHLTLNFPKDSIHKIEATPELNRGFDLSPIEVYKGQTDYLFVYETENQIVNCIANLEKIAAFDARGVIITAKGDTVDFVSRFFAPQSGINEDAVTGSAHTTLIPFWSDRLDKKKLTAMQLSKRTGSLQCELLNDRVAISGQAKLYMKGEIFID
jgi:PhzF family phenazine biosynthesis protein